MVACGGGLFKEGLGDIEVTELNCVLMWLMEFLVIGVIFLQLLVMLPKIELILEAWLWCGSAGKGRLEGAAGERCFGGVSWSV